MLTAGDRSCLCDQLLLVPIGILVLIASDRSTLTAGYQRVPSIFILAQVMTDGRAGHSVTMKNLTHPPGQ